MPSIEGAGVELAYEERGTGAAIVLVHGVAADGAALAPLAQALAPRARVITYDRRGYGGSGAPEPYEATTVHEQADDAAAVIAGLGAAPALVAGDGFGALVTLDLLLRRPELVRAAVLANPPLFQLVADATAALSGQRAELEEALRAGGPEAAVEGWLGGRAEGDALARAKAAHRAFFADFGGLATLPVTRRELRALAVPVVVFTHAQAPPEIVAVADALAALIPGVRRESGVGLAGAIGSLL